LFFGETIIIQKTGLFNIYVLLLQYIMPYFDPDCSNPES